MQKMILPDRWDIDNISPIPNRKAKRMKKQNILLVISSVVLLCMALIAISSFAFLKFNATLASNAIYHNNQSSQNQAMSTGNRPVIT
ncbi:MAG TPA: hypothetical protein VIX20_14715, partial [Ktedonobacteraceae bacterium]